MSVPPLSPIYKVITKSRKRTKKWQIEWLTRAWDQPQTQAFRNCDNCSPRGRTHRKAQQILAFFTRRKLAISSTKPHVHPSITSLCRSPLLPENLRFLFQLPSALLLQFTYPSLRTKTHCHPSETPTDRFCSRIISKTEPTQGKRVASCFRKDLKLLRGTYYIKTDAAVCQM